MPTHLPHHPQHRHSGTGHPPAPVGLSLLRMSLVERVGLSGIFIAILWAAVLWAMTGS